MNHILRTDREQSKRFALPAELLAQRTILAKHSIRFFHFSLFAYAHSQHMIKSHPAGSWRRWRQPCGRPRAIP